MQNGLVFPCLCFTTYFGMAGWCSCVLGLSGNWPFQQKTMTACQWSRDRSSITQWAQPSAWSRDTLFGCIESIREIQFTSHVMTCNQVGLHVNLHVGLHVERLYWRVTEMGLPVGGFEASIQSPSLFSICSSRFLPTFILLEVSYLAFPSTCVSRIDPAFSPFGQVLPGH